MTKNLYIPLKNRAILSISGSDASTFLQGLITNDITKATENTAIYALMLTPQGKFLYDFFITFDGDRFLIDCSREKLPEISKKLSMYKLRSDVKIETAEYSPFALLGDKVFELMGNKTSGSAKITDGNIIYVDPRSSKIYGRAIIKKDSPLPAGFEPGSDSDYNEIRINACIPEADLDMLSTAAFPLHFNMNELNAVDYKKGCYVGQEVTARMNHRGAIRKKLYVADLKGEGLPPPVGEPIINNSEKIGTALSATNSAILCLLIIEKVENQKNLYRMGDSEIILRE